LNSVFYCPAQNVTLENLLDAFRAHGLVDSINKVTPHRVIVYHGDTWFHIIENEEPFTDIFEEPQLVVLQSAGITRVFQFLYREELFNEVKEYLQVAIASFGGWVGLDDGLFENRLDCTRINPVSSSQHS
jgi:hypothetical protein